jgi:glycine cleavage system H protein
LYAPLGGEVVEVNSSVADNVGLLAEDPYEAGWLIKLKVAPPVDCSALLDLDAYEKQVAQEGH